MRVIVAAPAEYQKCADRLRGLERFGARRPARPSERSKERQTEQDFLIHRECSLAVLCGGMFDGPPSLRLLSFLAFGPDLRQKGHESGCGRRRLGHGHLDRHLE